MSLSAGVAVRDISPRQPIFLAGYPHLSRDSTGIHDPLLASALCLFEFVYLSRADSKMYGTSVHEVRREMGRRLAAQAPVDADLVIPIPDR